MGQTEKRTGFLIERLTNIKKRENEEIQGVLTGKIQLDDGRKRNATNGYYDNLRIRYRQEKRFNPRQEKH